MMKTHCDLIHARWDGNPETLKFVPELNHHIYVPKDDGGPICFEWHFPRRILSPRMSGYEIATFLLHHMAAIIGQGLFRHRPRVEREFATMYRYLYEEKPTLIGYEYTEDGKLWKRITDSAEHKERFKYRPNFVTTEDDMNPLFNTRAVYEFTPEQEAYNRKRKKRLDRLLTWIRIPPRQEHEDTIVYLDLNERTPQPAGKAYFV